MPELTPKEKLAKIREKFPYVDMCYDHKAKTINLTVETLYDLLNS